MLVGKQPRGADYDNEVLRMNAQREEWLEYAENCHHAGQKIVANASIWETDVKRTDPKLIALLLLIRTLSNFKGVMSLARQNLVVEARILTRCCIENSFTAVAIDEQGASFISNMIDDQKADRKSRGEFLLMNATGKTDPDSDQKLRSFLGTLGKSKGRSLNPRRIAETGPLRKGYAYYAQLSADACHPSLDALMRYLTERDMGGRSALSVDINPVIDEKELRDTVNIACEAMIGVCVSVNALLGGPDDPELTRLIKQMGCRAAAGTPL
jgi:hypothetical protein